jgi:hypothetical protein
MNSATLASALRVAPYHMHWRHIGSHGYRQILENMGAAGLTFYRAECFRQLQQHRQPVSAGSKRFSVCATRLTH